MGGRGLWSASSCFSTDWAANNAGDAHVQRMTEFEGLADDRPLSIPTITNSSLILVQVPVLPRFLVLPSHCGGTQRRQIQCAPQLPRVDGLEQQLFDLRRNC